MSSNRRLNRNLGQDTMIDALFTLYLFDSSEFLLLLFLRILSFYSLLLSFFYSLVNFFSRYSTLDSSSMHSSLVLSEEWPSLLQDGINSNGMRLLDAVSCLKERGQCQVYIFIHLNKIIKKICLSFNSHKNPPHINISTIPSSFHCKANNLFIILVFIKQSQQYSMSFHEYKKLGLGDNKRTTMFPSLKKTFYQNKSLAGRNINEFSLDEKAYRMTSNHILKGLLRHNDSEIRKLRETFVKVNGGDEKGKKKIGQYEIIKQIGKGGFAQVYEVQDPNHVKYALKEYNLQNSVECFHNEGNLGQFFFQKGKIKEHFQPFQGSNNIIGFVDKFKIGKWGYIVQELSEHNLSKLISEIQGIFHNNERIYQVKFKQFYKNLVAKGFLKKLMLQICQAVSLINTAGFIHCDLKLQNIMVQFQGEEPIVKIIDFGSTFQLKYGLPKITITPEYMPPQLLSILENGSNDYQILKKVDVWSIGCILLQILTGMPLWFRYKCRVQVKGRATVQLGIFALTGRQYHKIIKKQRQLCQNINKVIITHKQLQKYRHILKKLLTFNPQKRLNIEQCIQLFGQIEQ